MSISDPIPTSSEVEKIAVKFGIPVTRDVAVAITHAILGDHDLDVRILIARDYISRLCADLVLLENDNAELARYVIMTDGRLEADHLDYCIRQTAFNKHRFNMAIQPNYATVQPIPQGFEGGSLEDWELHLPSGQLQRDYVREFGQVWMRATETVGDDGTIVREDAVLNIGDVDYTPTEARDIANSILAMLNAISGKALS